MAHIILVCKYRKPLLLDFDTQVKELLSAIAHEHDFEIFALESDKDHVHLLVRYQPTQSIFWLVRTLKQLSTYRIWRLPGMAAKLSCHFWRERTFWSDGYFACSTGNASAATIARYIENQG